MGKRGVHDVGLSWLVLISTSCLMFIETGVLKSFGVLLPTIREQMVTETWKVGFSISLIPGIATVVCIFAGAMSKLFQARLTIMMCSLLASFGLLVTSFASNVFILMFAMLLTGFASGTTSVSAALLPQYFDKYYDTAVTVYTSGLSLGMVVMPVVTQWLLFTYGWRGTILILCGLSLQGLICSALLRPNKSNNIKDNVKSQTIKQLCVHLGKYFDIDLLSSSSFVAMLSIYAGDGIATTGWLIYVVPHVLQVGFTPYETSIVAVVGGIAHVAGNLVYPLLLRWASCKTQVYISMVMMLCSFLLDVPAGYCSSYVGLIICSIAFGVGAGLNKTASLPTVKEFINDEDRLANAMGLLYAGYGLASILSGFTCGWLFDYTGSYAFSFLFLSASCLFTTVPLCIDDLRKRNKTKYTQI